MKTARIVALLLSLMSLAGLIGCGGGGGGSPSSYTPPGTPPSTPPPASSQLTIEAALTPGVVGRAYSWTMRVHNGTAPYRWSATGLPPELSLDANTGAITGTPTTARDYAVTFEVTDSSSPPQTACLCNYGFTVSDRLRFFTLNFITIEQYNPITLPISATGGISPYTYSLSGGTLPPGMKFNSVWNSAKLTGGPLEAGQYTFSLTVSDQLTPPDVYTQQFTLTVKRPPLTVANSLPSLLPLNRPYSGTLLARGGIPPYSFALNSGTLPVGITLDTSSGRISGTPSAPGLFGSTLLVSDSSSPKQIAYQHFDVTVAAPRGRNDSPATATLVGNSVGGFGASISPYIDPPNGTPAAGDNDYYAVRVMPGSTLHVETKAKRANSQNPVDTVIEIVDGNGIRLSTCRQPGDTSNNFTSECINDDMGLSPHVQDSAIDYRVAGSISALQTVYVHVLDWRGDARPDMRYGLNVTGAFFPITFLRTTLPNGAVNQSYYESIFFSGGTGILRGSIVSGQLPPGLRMSDSPTSIDYSILISGVPTAAGTHTFTLQVTDEATPQQAATHSYTISVNSQLQLANFSVPALTAGSTFTQQAQASGGVPPYRWSMGYSSLPGISVGSATGLVTITPTAAGNYYFNLFFQDTGPPVQNAFQTIQVTVNAAP